MIRTTAPIAGAALPLASSVAARISGGAGCGVGHHGVGERGVGVTRHPTNRNGGRNRLGPRR
ncbi:MAG: hypothetical protein WB715_12460 [Roseiarcus sp.]|uniref:hypothetical protein n=1 Tax=Roseiarcus sp. TaxID=1969460 RepID=UPI003C4E6654